MPNMNVAFNVVGQFLNVTSDFFSQHQYVHFGITSEYTGNDMNASGGGSMLDFVNQGLREYEPTTLMLGAAVMTVGAYYALEAARKAQAVYQQTQFYSTSQMKRLLIDKTVEFLSDKPYIGPKIQGSINKKVVPLLKKIEADLNTARRALGPTLPRLPSTATSPADILKITEQANQHHHEGRSSGTVYFRPNSELEALIDKVYSHTKLTNPMHGDEYPSVRKMIAEVISWCQNLFHGDVNTENYKFPGMITDGGTSSIFESLSAYVRYARNNKGIAQPEIIVPNTAHVAFENAAERLGVKLIKVPVDPLTGGADVSAMEQAISKNTCLIVGSAPSFPCGVIDPIQDLAAMAARHHIPVHVDACLGGFLTAFAKKAGVDLPSCDFSVPNVMSISVDPHKYGQTPKGSSVLLFHPNAPVSPIYTNLEWEGGMYVAEGMKGSRPGNVAATTWATMLYFGEAGYVEETQRILAFTQKLTAAIKSIPGMVVPFDPKLSVITLDTEGGINASLVASLLKKNHWHLNIIKAGGFHFCVTALHESMQEMILKEFIQDLTDAVEYARKHPDEKPKGLEGVYGQLDEIPSFVQNRVGESYAAMSNSLSSELYQDEVKKVEAVKFTM